jgi:hypothetical protein
MEPNRLDVVGVLFEEDGARDVGGFEVLIA